MKTTSINRNFGLLAILLSAGACTEKKTTVAEKDMGPQIIYEAIIPKYVRSAVVPRLYIIAADGSTDTLYLHIYGLGGKFLPAYAFSQEWCLANEQNHRRCSPFR